jgi:hypothetical protein
MGGHGFGSSGVPQLFVLNACGFVLGPALGA